MEKKVRNLSEKAISILLCVLMIFSSVNLTVFADNQDPSGQEEPGYDAEAWAELMDEDGTSNSKDYLNDPSGTQVYVEPATGITWVYTVSGGEATITKSYIGTQTNKVYGKVTVPTSLGVMRLRDFTAALRHPISHPSFFRRVSKTLPALLKDAASCSLSICRRD
jgi:hypothetical protein